MLINKKKAQEDKDKMRESPSGFSFYSTYKSCNRLFYLKYVNGLQPLVKAPPLTFGSAFHDAKKLYWEGPYNADGMIKEFEDSLLSMKDEYEDVEKYKDDLSRGRRMIDNWLYTHHDENQERYVPLAVEQQYDILLGPNKDFLFTIRPDVILKDKKFGKNLIEDTKSTGWSLDMVFKTNALNDQLSSYIFGVRKVHPEWRIETARIDCSYARGKKVESQRGMEIYRSKGDLAVFEMGLYGIILEVSQKYKSLSKYPWPVLFPRNGGHCYKYNKPCPYSDICRMNIPIGTVPPGFKLDPWASLENDMKKAQGSFSLGNFALEGKKDG